VDSVTEGVENRGDIDVEISTVTPHISSWHHDQLGKSAVPVNTHALGVWAQLSTTCSAIAAATANDVPLDADEVTDIDAVDAWANRLDVARYLVTENDRWRHHGLR
jgi:hypothetical protein